jgi:hypothetical protein
MAELSLAMIAAGVAAGATTPVNDTDMLASITKHDNSCAWVLLLETSLLQMSRSDIPDGRSVSVLRASG